MGPDGDDFEGCPKCKTSLEQFPNLLILYSTCCGWKLCVNCVDELFTVKSSVICGQCPKTVTRKLFVNQDLDLQFYNSEIDVRKKLSRLVSLSLEDFNNDTDKYNDYLETFEDWVYDIAHGTEEEKEEAEKRFKVFRKENAALIKTSRDKRLLRESELRMGKMEMDVETIEASAAGSTPAASDSSMPLPTPMMGPTPVLPKQLPKTASKLHSLEGTDTSKMSKEEKRQHEVDMAVYMERRRRAGGYQRVYDAERSTQEALAALGFNL